MSWLSAALRAARPVLVPIAYDLASRLAEEALAALRRRAERELRRDVAPLRPVNDE